MDHGKEGNRSYNKYGMGVFVVVLLTMNVFNIFGPFQGDSLVFSSVLGLTMYMLFAGVAFGLDGKRS